MKLSLTINNKQKILQCPPNRTLMELLKSQGFWSVRYGCETGTCGSCTVLVNDLAINSCIMLAAQVESKSVETFETLSDTKELTLPQEVLMDFGNPDCGFCISGMMMSMKALLKKISDPTEEEMIDALRGNLCRCTKNVKPITAIMEAVKKTRGKW